MDALRIDRSSRLRRSKGLRTRRVLLALAVLAIRARVRR